LRRGTFEFYWAEINRLRELAENPPPEQVAFSSLVSWLDGQWQKAVRSESNLSGHETEADSSLLVWHATPARLTALFAPARWLAASMQLPDNAGGIRWSWTLPGSPPAAIGKGMLHIGRSLAEAQLPGRLDFASPLDADNDRVRRSLWLAGVGLMVLLVAAGAYAMYRGVNRELRVAQLQSDFVAAVSHEFRSPLTTLRTISELLAQDRIVDETRRRQSFVFLEREAGRLHRLVEDLLDFGRMEAANNTASRPTMSSPSFGERWRNFAKTSWLPGSRSN
jgi:signal transduction histidine kinase